MRPRHQSPKDRIPNARGALQRWVLTTLAYGTSLSPRCSGGLVASVYTNHLQSSIGCQDEPSCRTVELRHWFASSIPQEGYEITPAAKAPRCDSDVQIVHE